MSLRRTIVAIIAAIAVALSAGCAPDPASRLDASEEEKVLFEGRPNRLENDKERNVGESVELYDETKATLTGYEFVQEISATERDGYLVINATVENITENKRKIRYDRLDWAVQFPDGTKQNRIAAYEQEGQLGEGELEPGQSASGKVIFKIGATKGDFFVLYAPRSHANDPESDRERGVWKVTVA